MDIFSDTLKPYIEQVNICHIYRFCTKIPNYREVEVVGDFCQVRYTGFL